MKAILIILLAGLGCSANAQTEFSYSDGNNNTYSFKKVSSANTSETEYIASYQPVPIDRSSSGEYSGGIPLQKNISCDMYESLYKLLVRYSNDKKQQIKQREMGSGMIIYAMKKKQKMYFLSPRSAAKKEIEQKMEEVFKKQIKQFFAHSYYTY